MAEEKKEKPVAKKETSVAVSRSSYNKMLGGMVIAFVLVAFSFGFILGDSFGGPGIVAGQAAPSDGSGSGNGVAPAPTQPEARESVRVLMQVPAPAVVRV